MKAFAAIFLFFCLALANETNYERKTYDGYQVVEIVPESVQQLKVLRNLMTDSDLLLDFWAEPVAVDRPVTIMASPLDFIKLQIILLKENIKFTKTIENVMDLVQPEWEQMEARRKSGKAVFDLNQFNTLADIYSWMDNLRFNCRSGVTCDIVNAGNSHLQNPLQIFRIRQTGANRKAIWIDSTIHAREWIAPATVVNVLDSLARGTSANAIRLTNNYDWYIMPVMNPDGYLYTFSNERLWRKNRRPNTGSTCIGTDLNRNFNFRWGREGVSTNPCQETFCGASAASEPETRAVQTQLNNLGSTITAMVTVHSYGNMWMFPWGNTVNHAGSVCERASDHAELMRVSDLTANAIQNTYGTRWARGNSCEVIYQTTGGTDDYAKGVSGIKYAFCPELRGTSFIIAASQIALSYMEFWNGIVSMADNLP